MGMVAGGGGRGMFKGDGGRDGACAAGGVADIDSVLSIVAFPLRDLHIETLWF